MIEQQIFQNIILSWNSGGMFEINYVVQVTRRCEMSGKQRELVFAMDKYAQNFKLFSMIFALGTYALMHGIR